MPHWYPPIFVYLMIALGVSTPAWAMRAASFETCAALLITTEARLSLEEIAERTRESIYSLNNFALKNLDQFQSSPNELPTNHIFVDNQSKPLKKNEVAVNIRAVDKVYLKYVLSPSQDMDLMGITVRGDAAIRQFLEEYRQNLEPIIAGTNQYSRSFRERHKFNYRFSSVIVAAAFLNLFYYAITGDNDHFLAKPILFAAFASGSLGYLPVTFSVDGQVWLMRFVESEKSKLKRFFEILDSKDESRWVFANRATQVPSTFPRTPSERPDLIEHLAVPISSSRLGIPERGHQWADLSIDQALYFEKDLMGQIEPVLNMIVRVYKPLSR